MDEPVDVPQEDGAGQAPPPPPPETGSSVPFEDRSQPFITRLLETIKMAFADPVRLFSNMPEEDIGPPVVYGLVLGTVVTVFWVVWEMSFGTLAMVAGRASAEDIVVSTGVLSFFLVASPVFVLVGIFINAAIFHVMLLLVGDGSRGFGVTLRAYCYGTTPNLLCLIPICGGLVGGLWSMVLVIIAAIYGHRTDPWRAIVAYFLPIVICCCCLSFFFSTILGFLGLAGR